MTYQQIIQDIKNKVYHPLYYLTGEEPFYIDQICKVIEGHVLTETEREFNQTVLYGKDTTAEEIVSCAKRYPMMANYQVVVVKEAQEIRNLDKLEPYIDQPQPTTILVLCVKYRKIDKRKTYFKKIDKKGVLFESSRLYDYKMPDWISGYVKEKRYSITPKAAVLLVESLGTDLGKTANEIDKLMINLPAGTEINVQHIEENIGISKDYNTFELQHALGCRDVVKANRIILYFAVNEKEHPLPVTMVVLYNFFSKLLIYLSLQDRSRNNVAAALSVIPYFVNDYMNAAKHYNVRQAVKVIALLREYDVKSKGVDSTGAVSDGELLKEMAYRILQV